MIVSGGGFAVNHTGMGGLTYPGGVIDLSCLPACLPACLPVCLSIYLVRERIVS